MGKVCENIEEKFLAVHLLDDLDHLRLSNARLHYGLSIDTRVHENVKHWSSTRLPVPRES
jgi:hypothetical protein